MTVLIVEDEKSIRVSAAMAIKVEGHIVHAVSNVTEALAALNEQVFDMAIIDLMLGDESGLVLVKNIRKQFPNTIPFVITAKSGDDEIKKAVAAGAEYCLLKPFTPSDLRDLLAICQGKLLDQ